MTKSMLLNGILCGLLSTANVAFGMKELSGSEDKPLAVRIYLYSEKDAQYHPLNNDGLITPNSPIFVNENFRTMHLEDNSHILIQNQYNASLVIQKDQCSLAIENNNNNQEEYTFTPVISSTITPAQINYFSQQKSTTRENDQQSLAFALDRNNNVYHLDRTIIRVIDTQSTTSSPMAESDTTKEIQPNISLYIETSENSHLYKFVAGSSITKDLSTTSQKEICLSHKYTNELEKIESSSEKFDKETIELIDMHHQNNRRILMYKDETQVGRSSDFLEVTNKYKIKNATSNTTKKESVDKILTSKFKPQTNNKAPSNPYISGLKYFAGCSLTAALVIAIAYRCQALPGWFIQGLNTCSYNYLKL